MGFVRVVLAFSVVIWHLGAPAPFHLLNAAVAVLCFFIISGFYMAMVINEKYAPGGGVWIRSFYWGRFLRLAPAYYFMLAFSVVWYVLTRNPSSFWQADVTLSEKLTLLWLNVGVIGQDAFQLLCTSAAKNTALTLIGEARETLSPAMFNCGLMLVGQAWSLSSEILFYALAPFVVRSPRRIVVLLLASLAVRYAVIDVVGLRSGIWDYWFFPATLCMFLMGALSYHIWRRIKPTAALGWTMLITLTLWFVLTALRDAIILPSPANWAIDRPEHWAAYVIFALAVPPIFSATRDIRFDREIGELSYPLYLVHGLGLGIFYDFSGFKPSSPAGLVIASILCATAAWGISFLIERPFRR